LDDILTAIHNYQLPGPLFQRLKLSLPLDVHGCLNFLRILLRGVYWKSPLLHRQAGSVGWSECPSSGLFTVITRVERGERRTCADNLGDRTWSILVLNVYELLLFIPEEELGVSCGQVGRDALDMELLSPWSH